MGCFSLRCIEPAKPHGTLKRGRTYQVAHCTTAPCAQRKENNSEGPVKQKGRSTLRVDLPENHLT